MTTYKMMKKADIKMLVELDISTLKMKDQIGWIKELPSDLAQIFFSGSEYKGVKDAITAKIKAEGDSMDAMVEQSAKDMAKPLANDLAKEMANELAKEMAKDLAKPMATEILQKELPKLMDKIKLENLIGMLRKKARKTKIRGPITNPKSVTFNFIRGERDVFDWVKEKAKKEAENAK